MRTYCLHATLKAFPYLASASSTVVMYAGSRVTHEVMLPQEGQSSAITCVVAPAPRPPTRMANWRQLAAAAATGGVDYYVDRLQKSLPDKEVGSDRECAEGPHPRLVLVRACAGSPTLSQASASRLLS